MAVAYNAFEEEKDQQLNQDGGTQLGTESAVVTEGKAPQSAGDTGSGQYTNLQSYLDANASLRQGQNLAGKVGETVKQADDSQAQAESEFKSQVDSSAVRPDDELLNEVSLDPTKVVSDEQKRNQFIKMRDASYKGPSNLSDNNESYAKAFAAQQKAQNQVKNAQTESGRFALLDQYYARPDYTYGQKKLDQLLVQNDPSSRAAFEDLQAKGQASQENFQNLLTNLNQYAQGAKADTAAARKSARDLVGIDDAGNLAQSGLIPGQVSALDKKVQDEINQRNALISQISSGFPQMKSTAGAITGRDLLDRGLAVGNPNKTYVGAGNPYSKQVNPESFIMADPEANINRRTVASQDEAARLQALAELSGLQNTWLSGDQEIGRYAGDNNNPYFNTSGYNDAAVKARDALAALIASQVKGTLPSSTDPNALSSGPNIDRRIQEVIDQYMAGELKDPSLLMRPGISRF